MILIECLISCTIEQAIGCNSLTFWTKIGHAKMRCHYTDFLSTHDIYYSSINPIFANRAIFSGAVRHAENSFGFQNTKSCQNCPGLIDQNLITHFWLTRTKKKWLKYTLWSLKWKCHHFDEIFFTFCTRSCHCDNLCSKWWKFQSNSWQFHFLPCFVDTRHFIDMRCFVSTKSC